MWEIFCTLVSIFTEIQICLFSVISPTLRYNDEVVVRDTSRQARALSRNVASCGLINGGPPVPEILELVILQGDAASQRAENPVQDPQTCTWSFPNRLELDLSDLTDQVRRSSKQLKVQVLIGGSLSLVYTYRQSRCFF